MNKAHQRIRPVPVLLSLSPFSCAGVRTVPVRPPESYLLLARVIPGNGEQVLSLALDSLIQPVDMSQLRLAGPGELPVMAVSYRCRNYADARQAQARLLAVVTIGS